MQTKQKLFPKIMSISLALIMILSVITMAIFQINAQEVKPNELYNLKLKTNEDIPDGAIYKIIKIADINNKGEEITLKEVKTIGKVEIKNHQAEYQIKEKGKFQVLMENRALGYYLNDKPATITIPPIKNGKLTYDDTVLLMKSELINRKIKLMKVNTNNEPLSKAIFALKKTQVPAKIDPTNNKVIEWTPITEKTQNIESNKNGEIVLENLKEGKYKLSEIKAPENYNITDKTIEIEVNHKDILIDGKKYDEKNMVKIINKKIEESPKITKSIVTPENTEMKRYITAPNLTYKYKLEISNVSYKKSGIQIIDKLENEISINEKNIQVMINDKIVKPIIDFKNNELKIFIKDELKNIKDPIIKVLIESKIKENTVKQKEIPNIADLVYDIDNNKKISSNKVIVKTMNGSALFKKVNSKKEPLANAKFRLYKEVNKKSNNSIEYKGKIYDIFKDNIISKDNGDVEINDLNIGRYIIKETKAPTGYITSDQIIEFEINEEKINQELTDFVNYKKGQVSVNTGNKTILLTGLIFVTLATIGGLAYFKTKYDDKKNNK